MSVHDEDGTLQEVWRPLQEDTGLLGLLDDGCSPRDLTYQLCGSEQELLQVISVTIF